MTPRVKRILQNLAIYGVASCIILYVARGVSWRDIVTQCRHANLLLFIPAALGGFLCWDVGEALLFAGFVTFWMWWRPQTRFGEWLHSRPALVAFRHARPEHYLKLGSIRAPIFIAQAFLLYLELASFNVHVPLAQVLAFAPAVLFL